MNDPTIIPLVPSLPYYRFTTTLDAEQYVFDVRWNARDAAWYLDLYEIEGAAVAMGIKLVLGVGLGRKSTHHLFVDSILKLVDTSGARRDAGFDDMGTRVLLYFYSADVLAGTA